MLQCGTPANVGHWPRRTRPEARPNANCGQLRATLWFSADAAGPALMIANEQDSKNSESACVPDQCTMIWPQQRLYFLPDPEGHGSLRPTFSVGRG